MKVPVAPPRPIEAVVFDMDGLLVDSERLFRDSMVEVTRDRGGELPDAVFLSMIGAQREQNRQVALNHFGDAFDYDSWIEAVSAHARERIEAGLALKTGVVELLDYLEQEGVPRAIATSSGHRTVALQLGRHGLIERFQSIVASGDYARGKPFADPFLAAAERLGVEPGACLALEDSHNGVRAAHAAGMMTIMVPDLLEATGEMRGLCLAVADTLHDVRDLLIASRR